MSRVTDERFDSWKEIAAYLRRDVRTVRRWEKARSLPVHRLPGDGRQAVYAFRNEIEAWLSSRTELAAVGSVSEQGVEDNEPPGIAAPTEKIGLVKSARVDDVLTPEARQPKPWLRFSWASGAIVIFGAALIMLIVRQPKGGQAALVPRPEGEPKIISVSPILPLRDQAIVIKGSGFGLHTPYRNADTPFIAIRDKTAQWAAGRIIPQNWDAVTLDLRAWQDTQIDISGFSGAYGSGHWQLAKGDEIEIAVWNPQSGRGPAVYQLTVSASPESAQLSSPQR